MTFIIRKLRFSYKICLPNGEKITSQKRAANKIDSPD
jgi:hypothetical protein